ncbi:MAG: hypothetical protein HC880_09495 [Bacteroidia bacterium]|nr:hypothetical protein [Bacteroidia bacterium]
MRLSYEIILEEGLEAENLIRMLQSLPVVKNIIQTGTSQPSWEERRAKIQEALLQAPQWTEMEADSWAEVEKTRKNWRSYDFD